MVSLRGGSARCPARWRLARWQAFGLSAQAHSFILEGDLAIGLSLSGSHCWARCMSSQQFSESMTKTPPNLKAANPAVALWLESMRPVGRVAELGSLGFHALLVKNTPSKGRGPFP